MQTTAQKQYTVRDYMRLEEGAPYQLIRGKLVMSPAPSIKHQETVGTIYRQIANYLEKNLLGKVFCSLIDVHFDEENVLQPDVVFIAQENLKIIRENAIYGAPDLIVEVLSSFNSYYDWKEKKGTYSFFGVKEYWIVDPQDKEVVGFRNTDNGFVEFFKGKNSFSIELLNLKISI